MPLAVRAFAACARGVLCITPGPRGWALHAGRSRWISPSSCATTSPRRFTEATEGVHARAGCRRRRSRAASSGSRWRPRACAGSAWPRGARQKKRGPPQPPSAGAGARPRWGAPILWRPCGRTRRMGKTLPRKANRRGEGRWDLWDAMPPGMTTGGTTPRGDEAAAGPGTPWMEAMRGTQRNARPPPTCVSFAHRARMLLICAKPFRFGRGVVGCMIRGDRGPLVAACCTRLRRVEKERSRARPGAGPLSVARPEACGRRPRPLLDGGTVRVAATAGPPRERCAGPNTLLRREAR